MYCHQACWLAVPVHVFVAVSKGVLFHRKIKKLKIFYTLIDRPLGSSTFSRYLSKVPVGAQSKIASFLRWQDAHASLFGFLLLIDALNAMGYNGERLVRAMPYDGLQKPQIHNGQPFFNISHSGELVICAVSMEGELGIDVEKIRALEVSDFDSCWCKEEQDWLNTQEAIIFLFFLEIVLH
jgi:4'-phosphopantetheinyl transferase